MKVGVLAVQGAVSEHVAALEQAARKRNENWDIVLVRTPEDLAQVAGLILPGGESTTMSRLLRSSGLQPVILARAANGNLAMFGTCAGMILLSSRATHDVEDKGIELLGLLDLEVDRNAFGRQRESFEAMASVDGVGEVPTVYIRAPVGTQVWGETKALATDPKGIVVAQKGRIMATAFHPELTGDVRIHELFLELTSQALSSGA